VAEDFLSEILRRQQRSGFPDLAGAEAAVTVPIGDRLINEVITARTPADGPVRDVRIRSEEANHIQVAVRVSKGPLNIPVKVTLVIDEQPLLPQRPVLVLRLANLPGVLGLAGAALTFFDFLPPGISVDGQWIRINLKTVLARYGKADLLDYLTWLQVTTRPGAVVVSARAVVDYPKPSA
jgi:hypothetical protein